MTLDPIDQCPKTHRRFTRRRGVQCGLIWPVVAKLTAIREHGQKIAGDDMAEGLIGGIAHGISDARDLN
jgi:hypothetical protein